MTSFRLNLARYAASVTVELLGVVLIAVLAVLIARQAGVM